MIVIPPQYASYQTLDGFLMAVLKAYPTLKEVLDKFVDQSTDEYKAFHVLSLKDHVTLLHFRQHGVTFQLNRSSNIRYTAGYERYVLNEYDVEELQEDERIISYKPFIDEWLEWRTVPL